MIEKHTETVDSMSTPMASDPPRIEGLKYSLPVRSLSLLPSSRGRARALSVVKVLAPEPYSMHLVPWTRCCIPQLFILYLPVYRSYPVGFLGPCRLLQMPGLIAFTSRYSLAVAVVRERLTLAACTVFISLWLFQAPPPQFSYGG